MQPENPTINANTIDDDDDDEPPLLVSLDQPPEDDSPKTSDGTTPSSTAAAPAASTAPPSALPPCPVTILSGFLGSGKTTLIQYILHSPRHGKRIAVIENEFGQGGLDVESLIVRDNGNKQGNGKEESSSSSSALADLIELANGCVCCTVKDSLVTTLEALIQKKSDLDYILIECSGMANPGPIASLFWLDDALDSRLRLDGIVTICDAAHIAEQLETTQEAAQQIAYADRILLNKVDLLENKDNRATQQPKKQYPTADSLVDLIRQFHPLAPIRQTSYSSVPDLDWILDARCFDSDRFQAVEEAVRQIPSQLPSATTLEHDHSHNHGHGDDDDDDCAVCQAAAAASDSSGGPSHTHTSGITTIALQDTGTVDLQLFNRWLASVLWPNQDAANATLQSLIQDETKAAAHQNSLQNDESQRIFRMKGIVSVKQYTDSDTFDEAYIDGECTDNNNSANAVVDGMMRDQRRFILQSVHDLWDLYPAGDSLQWQKDEERTCKVVVIGKHLDETVLRDGFRECIV